MFYFLLSKDMLKLCYSTHHRMYILGNMFSLIFDIMCCSFWCYSTRCCTFSQLILLFEHLTCFQYSVMTEASACGSQELSHFVYIFKKTKCPKSSGFGMFDICDVFVKTASKYGIGFCPGWVMALYHARLSAALYIHKNDADWCGVGIKPYFRGNKKVCLKKNQNSYTTFVLNVWVIANRCSLIHKKTFTGQHLCDFDILLTLMVINSILPYFTFT